MTVRRISWPAEELLAPQEGDSSVRHTILCPYRVSHNSCRHIDVLCCHLSQSSVSMNWCDVTEQKSLPNDWTVRRADGMKCVVGRVRCPPVQRAGPRMCPCPGLSCASTAFSPQQCSIAHRVLCVSVSPSDIWAIGVRFLARTRRRCSPVLWRPDGKKGALLAGIKRPEHKTNSLCMKYGGRECVEIHLHYLIVFTARRFVTHASSLAAAKKIMPVIKYIFVEACSFQRNLLIVIWAIFWVTTQQGRLKCQLFWQPVCYVCWKVRHIYR